MYFFRIEQKNIGMKLPKIKEHEDDSHHTDAPFTSEDAILGKHLAFSMGDFLCDISDTYYQTKLTPVEMWMRVVRALRIHELKIVEK